VREIKIQKPIVIEEKMKQFEMDLIDMSNYEHFNEKTTFVLMVVDCHSKFLWARPLKNKTAELVAYELQGIILQEGAPEVISSDNGAEFSNETMSTLCTKFDIKQLHSLPYRPTSNGQIERVNGTLKRAINAYMTEHDSKRYIDALQHLVYAYNTAKHSTTKFSPFQLHRGRDAQISMIAHANIKKNAERMILNDMRKASSMEEPLVVGDKVRINGLALKKIRKLSAISRATKTLINWSKEIYEVQKVRKDANDVEEFQLKDSPEADRWFFRYQLMLVDEEALLKRRSVFDKEELNFGQKFDNEEHIKMLGMRRAERLEANKDQSRLEKEEEQVEKKKIVRLRKQVDHGAYITH
jgi:hypothetical protein